MSIKRIDLGLNLFSAAIGTILGSIYFVLGDYRVLVPALIALLSSTMVFTTMVHRKKEIISFLFAFILVFFNYNYRSETLEYSNLEARLSQYSSSSWRIITDPKDRFFKSEFLIEYISPAQASLGKKLKNIISPIRLIATSESRLGFEKDDLLILQEPVDLERLSKDKIKFTKKDKVFYKLNNSEQLRFTKHRLNYIDELRNQVSAYYQHTLSPDNALIITSLLLGNRSTEVPQDFIKNMRNLGLGHFLAASGFNLLILTLVLTWLFNITRVNTRISSLVSIVAILIYTGLAGFSPSIIRAAVFAISYLVLKFFNRKSLSLKLLIYLAALILVLDPYSMFDIGFQLSYLATAAIIVWTPLISQILEKLRMPKFLNDAVGVTLAVQFFVYPLTVYYFSNPQIWSLLANILLSPILSLLTIFAFCGLSPIIEPYLNGVKFIIAQAQHLPGIDYSQELSFNGLIFFVIFINILGYMIFQPASNATWDISSFKQKGFDENLVLFYTHCINNRNMRIAILISSLSMLTAVELDPQNINKYIIEQGLVKNHAELARINADKTINHAYFKIGDLDALIIKNRSSIKALGTLSNDIHEVNFLFLPKLRSSDMHLKTLLELTKPQFTICSVDKYDNYDKLPVRVKENLEIIGKSSNTIVNEAILYIKDNKYWQLKTHPL